MDIVTYALSKKYVAKSLDGLGALKGANCVIESIDTVPEGNRVTFSWTGTDGTIETSTMIVENGIDGNNGANGADGVGISKIEKIDTVGLEDTYRITFTNNTTYDYSVTNGQKGEQGIQGIRGEKGEQGEQGVQGIQGIKGEKGDDGYPFLIYKEYSDISEFNKNDFPEIGLMFMIVANGASSFPVYRYTGDNTVPYRYVTDLTGGEGIKGEKGDKGEQGEQGVQGENGKDGITYIPTIGTVTSGDIASATVVTKDETSTAEFSFVLPKGDNVTVDAILSNTSENPVQNKIVKQAIDNKADKTVATTSADGLMSAEDKSKLDGVATGANKTIVDTILSNTSTNPVQNKIVMSALAEKALKSKYGDTTIDVGRKAGTTVGAYSTAEGLDTLASGDCSHAEGCGTQATSNDAHAEGQLTIASGVRSHAEGVKTEASGEISHAEGANTKATGGISHAEGFGTKASAAYSHAEGYSTSASGQSSHAGGNDANASGNSSFSHGHYTKATHDDEIAFGKFNQSNDDTLFSIGDGTVEAARHNAFEITKTGGKLHDKDIAVKDDIVDINTMIYTVAFDSVSWEQSGLGKFYCSINLNNVNKIISVSLGDFNNFSPDEIVQPIVFLDQQIGIISNVAKSNGKAEIRVAYI